MSMFFGQRKGERKNSKCLLVSENIFPQTIDVLLTRANPLDIELNIKNEDDFELTDDIFAISCSISW